MAKTFIDIPKLHQNYYAAIYLSNHGIIKGYQDGTFKPYNKITRAELLKIVMEGTNKSIEIPNTNCFSDVPYTEWYAKYICTAKSLGIIEGYSDNTFKPNQNINKAEAMKIISKGYAWDMWYGIMTEPFKDVTTVDWFGGYVLYAKGFNLLPETTSNYDTPYYYPNEEISRGTVAEVIFRYLAITELGEEWYSEKLIDQLNLDAVTTPDENPLENSGPQTKNQNNLSKGTITVKLTWDNDKLDLDTHFLQPDGEEIYFMHKIDSNINAILENKNQSEILTINNLGNGTYEYFVNLFSGEEETFKASVEIYDSNGLAKIYTAPAETGKIWKVFELQAEYKLIDSNIVGACELLKHVSSACPSF